MEISLLLQASIMQNGVCRSSYAIIAFVVLSLLSFQICAGKNTMIRNDSITAKETVVSDGGHFALGFFSPENSSNNRYVGIWYNRIPDHMVIWVANRESPLTADSSGVLTFDGTGNLVILDGSGNAFWSTNISTETNNSRAELWDSGNLVLTEVDSSGRARRVVWQSFDHPTNTFMPTMMLGVNLKTNEQRRITSWKSASDPSLGSFSSGIDSQKLSQSLVWNGSLPHFRGVPWNGQTFLGIPQMTRRAYGNGYNIIRNEQQGTVFVSYAYSNSSFIANFVLDASGMFHHLVWSDEKAEWNILWSAPENRCEAYGTCGPFGSCSMFRKPICRCLRGFKPKSIEEWNVGNWSSGCVRRTPLKYCDDNNNSSSSSRSGINGSVQQGHGDEFFMLERVKPPDNTEWLPGGDVKACKVQCLNNCSCVAYAYDSLTECMLWSGSLIDVQEFDQSGPTGGVDLYIRVANSELDEKKDVKVLTIVIVVIGTLTMGVCAYFLWRWMINGDKKEGQEMPLFDMSVSGQASLGSSYMIIKHDKLLKLPLVDFKTVAVATDNFCAGNKLGEGGFGPVYKGKLANGQEIAVKRLSKSSGQGLEELKNEVMLISKLQHRNLVRLLGFCIEGEEKMLLYEFMPNKSLDAFLFDPARQTPLPWDKRFEIIEGIARGILYLHRDSRLRIIHRDLKASNILLDGELHPKISDFGMARVLGGDEMLARTKRVVGTYGYMSPEYAMEGRFSEKSDVFSFGVLVLEIVSSKKNSRFYGHEHSLNLLSYAWQLWNEGKLFNLVDPDLDPSSSQPEVLRCIHVGLLCVQEFAKDRPTMSSVVFMLSNDATTLPCPKQPAFAQRSPADSESLGHEICSINNVSVTFSLSQGR